MKTLEYFEIVEISVSYIKIVKNWIHVKLSGRKISKLPQCAEEEINFYCIFIIADASQAEFDGVSEVKVDTSHSNAKSSGHSFAIIIILLVSFLYATWDMCNPQVLSSVN